MTGTITGVILAGGANRRFGGNPKTTAVIGGKTIIFRILETIREFFDEIIIVTNTPGDFRHYKDVLITCDRYPGAGPLAGIHAAMQLTDNESLFVFAGDMPFLNREIIANQIGEYRKSACEILVPSVNNLIEPLHAIYKKSTLERLEKLLTDAKNHSVRDLIAISDTRYMTLQNDVGVLRAFSNINTPSDLEQLSNTYE